MLKLENISWSTPDGTPVLKDLNLEVPDGKLVVLTGPNGGGKTTLAKIIAGIYKQDNGKIYFDGRDITEVDITERAKMGISFAFQQPVRFKGITVQKLLELAAGKKLERDVTCDIIATVLARNSKLTVFDEPEAGIDLWSFTNLIHTFEEMRKSMDGTIIIISHQERILKIADEIAIVADGRIKMSGAADDMMKSLAENKSIIGRCSKQEALF